MSLNRDLIAPKQMRDLPQKLIPNSRVRIIIERRRYSLKRFGNGYCYRDKVTSRVGHQIGIYMSVQSMASAALIYCITVCCRYCAFPHFTKSSVL